MCDSNKWRFGINKLVVLIQICALFWREGNWKLHQYSDKSPTTIILEFAIEIEPNHKLHTIAGV